RRVFVRTRVIGTPFPKTTPPTDLRQMPRQWNGRTHHDRTRRKTLRKGAERAVPTWFSKPVSQNGFLKTAWASLRSAHPTKRTNEKGSRTPTDAGLPASPSGEARTLARARSPVGVPLRLSPGRQLVPKAQRQAMLSGTVRSVRSCTAAPTGERRPCASSRALPAPEQQTNVPVQRAPRVPVIVPAGLMPKPPECGGDEPSARGHRNPLRQPSSPASVLVRERDEFF